MLQDTMFVDDVLSFSRVQILLLCWKKSRPTSPFLGWRKRTVQNRDDMSRRGLSNKCAVNLGQPRPEWGNVALPSRSTSSISSTSNNNDNNMPQTFSVSPAEGSGKNSNNYGSSSGCGSGSPVLLSTPAGMRGSFAPAIDMTGDSIIGGAASDTIVKKFNADIARGMDDR